VIKEINIKAKRIKTTKLERDSSQIANWSLKVIRTLEKQIGQEVKEN